MLTVTTVIKEALSGRRPIRRQVALVVNIQGLSRLLNCRKRKAQQQQSQQQQHKTGLTGEKVTTHEEKMRKARL